jgi:hypothetical protein
MPPRFYVDYGGRLAALPCEEPRRYQSFPILAAICDGERSLKIGRSCDSNSADGEIFLYRLTETESANGFGNRFLWFAVRRSKCLAESGKDFGIARPDFALASGRTSR